MPFNYSSKIQKLGYFLQGTNTLSRKNCPESQDSNQAQKVLLYGSIQRLLYYDPYLFQIFNTPVYENIVALNQGLPHVQMAKKYWREPITSFGVAWQYGQVRLNMYGAIPIIEDIAHGRET